MEKKKDIDVWTDFLGVTGPDKYKAMFVARGDENGNMVMLSVRYQRDVDVECREIVFTPALRDGVLVFNVEEHVIPPVYRSAPPEHREAVKG